MNGQIWLNDWGKPAQSWGRASSILGQSQLNVAGEPAQCGGRASSMWRESQLTQAALNPLSKLLACSDQPQKLRSARLTHWVCQVFASLLFPFYGYTRVWYVVIRSRIHLEPKLRCTSMSIAPLSPPGRSRPAPPAHQTAPPTHPRKANIVPSSRHVICYNPRYSNHLVNSGSYPQKNLHSPRTLAIFTFTSGLGSDGTGWVGWSLDPHRSNQPRLYFRFQFHW